MSVNKFARNSHFCSLCKEDKVGFSYLDRSADRDDIVFICFSCGSLMTNSQENLNYYNTLLDILEVQEIDELSKSIALENHFQNIYKSDKIKNKVKKFMFENGRWV